MDDKTKKKEKKGGPAGNIFLKNLLAALLLVLFLVFGAQLALNLITRHGKTTTVPDLTSLTVDEAAKVAAESGVKIEVVDSIYVRKMEKGAIYTQNPKPGSTVKKGRRIMLTINNVNVRKVEMPNIVGLSTRQAKAELSSRGLNVGKLIYVKDIATNNVMRQLYNGKPIRPGRKIDAGSDIDIETGLNPVDDRTLVPRLKGMKYFSAIDLLHDNYLNLEKAVFDSTVRNYADTITATIYKQSPEKSKNTVKMGSGVTIYLSKNKHDE